MAITGFICHDDYLAKTAKLTDEEVGRLFRALMTYHITGEAAELDGRESVAFDFIREDIDKAEKAYHEKCEQNRRNRLSATDNSRDQSSTNVNDGQRTLTVVPNKIKENSKRIKENSNQSNKGRFTPPSVQEVEAYCEERGVFLINAESFVDYYAARGWVLTNGKKMVDWKAAVRLWESKERQRKTADDGLPY